MALNIVGTFPILNAKKSQTDEYGFDYITYQYTAKLSQLDSLLPKKDDKFFGISPDIFPAEKDYVVTNTETNLANGGLAEFSIQTTGTRNAIDGNAPKITLIPNSGPLIFGIGIQQPSQFFAADGSVGLGGRGITVQLEFLGEGGADKEAATISTYLFSVMPSIFRGTLMPIPKRLPGGFGDPSKNGIYGSYYGFRCKSVRTERRGGLTLYTLSFEEAGQAFRKAGLEAGGGATANTTIDLIYNFSYFA
jgi:hypothetical protein